MDPNTLTMIIIIAAAVIGVAALVYGILRKFTQMSWIAWQILILFGATLLISLLPEDLDATTQLIVALVILFGGVAIVVGGGALIRLAMLKKKTPANGIFRFFNRVLGALTALLNFVVIALVLAGLALPLIYYAIPALKEPLSVVFEMQIWTDFLAVHAFDLVLVTVFALAVRAGWRVGLLRAIVIWLLIAISFGAVFLALYLTIGTSFFTRLSATFAGWINMENHTIAAAIGGAITYAIIFIVLFVVICILGFFLTKLTRRLRYHYPVAAIDGTIGALIAFVITTAIVIGLYLAVMWLTTGAGETVQKLLANLNIDKIDPDSVLGVVNTIAEYTKGVGEMLAASPLSGMLYNGILGLGITG